MRVEIIPADRDSVVIYDQASTGNAANLLMNFNVWDDIDPIPNFQVPAYTARYASETFKALDCNKVHTIYRDNKPLAT